MLSREWKFFGDEFIIMKSAQQISVVQDSKLIKTSILFLIMAVVQD